MRGTISEITGSRGLIDSRFPFRQRDFISGVKVSQYLIGQRVEFEIFRKPAQVIRRGRRKTLGPGESRAVRIRIAE